MKISTSILSADFINLGNTVAELIRCGTDYIHVDVMDGSFVPCISIGSSVVQSLKNFTHIPLDVHLMVNNPEKQIEYFAIAGSDIITFHIEAVTHADKIISQIKSYKKKAGVSLVPSTNPSNIEYILDSIDLILVMTVNPGFAGQKFLSSQLRKIEEIKKMIEKHKSNALISVDGGVNIDNSSIIKNAGADILVVGSAMFVNNDYCGNMNKFRKAIS